MEIQRLFSRERIPLAGNGTYILFYIHAMNQLKGLLYGIVSSSTFGLIPLFALPALKAGVGLDSVMFYRFGLSTLALGIWLLIRRRDLRIS